MLCSEQKHVPMLIIQQSYASHTSFLGRTVAQASNFDFVHCLFVFGVCPDLEIKLSNQNKVTAEAVKTSIFLHR